MSATVAEIVEVRVKGTGPEVVIRSSAAWDELTIGFPGYEYHAFLTGIDALTLAEEITEAAARLNNSHTGAEQS